MEQRNEQSSSNREAHNMFAPAEPNGGKLLEQVVEAEQNILVDAWSQADPHRDADIVNRHLIDPRITGEWGIRRKRLAETSITIQDKTRVTSRYVFTGLALSGGGIRSATFSLGILQALAANGLLREFDYLSTVSGGGYLGASLRWWWAQGTATDPKGTERNDFPYGTEAPKPLAEVNAYIDQGESSFHQKQRLNFIRSNGNYLAPSGGADYFSAVAAVVRTVLQNLIVWIPIAAAMFVGLMALSQEIARRHIFDQLPNPLSWTKYEKGWGQEFSDQSNIDFTSQIPIIFSFFVYGAFGLLSAFVLVSILLAFTTLVTDDKANGNEAVPVWIALGGLLFLVLGLASLGTDPPKDCPTTWNAVLNPWAELNCSKTIVNWGIAAAMLAVGGIAVAIAALMLLLRETGDFAYQSRRVFEKISGKLFPVFILLLVLGLLPVMTFQTVSGMLSNGSLTQSAGGLGLAAGSMIALFRGTYSTARNLAPNIADRIFLPIGAALFILLVLILAYALAIFVSEENLTFLREWRLYLLVACGAILTIATTLSVVTNVNLISLHRFYRDRLMECFMPSESAVKRGRVRITPEAEIFSLDQAWVQPNRSIDDRQATWYSILRNKAPVNRNISRLSAGHHLPYPLINTNVILINDEQAKYRERGGDNFVLSPLYCGSSATGWVSTAKSQFRRMTLASAIAASGAAADAHSGAAGRGLTRDMLISVVMMFLNLRLGYWFMNPHPSVQNSAVSKYWRNPNHWSPGLFYSVTSRGYCSDSGFVELSDGGHFENLGVYELIRRRCRVILVCDGEQDKQTSYSSFVSLVRRIDEDFGTRVEFIPGHGPERLVASEDMSYPSGAQQSPQTFLVAKIIYADQSEAALIYIKSSVTSESSFKVKGYKGANPDFPNETTLDQFFDPVQFEAYREMGYEAAVRMISRLRLSPDSVCDASAILRAARRKGA